MQEALLTHSTGSRGPWTSILRHFPQPSFIGWRIMYIKVLSSLPPSSQPRISRRAGPDAFSAPESPLPGLNRHLLSEHSSRWLQGTPGSPRGPPAASLPPTKPKGLAVRGNMQHCRAPRPSETTQFTLHDTGTGLRVRRPGLWVCLDSSAAQDNLHPPF